MQCSEMWHCVVLVRTDVLEERITSIFRVGESCLHWFFACGFFYPEVGGDTFLRNIALYKSYTAPHPRNDILLLCSLFNSAASNLDHIVSNGWMIVNNELEGMWGEAVMT
jgi:hypothetical protein